MKLTTLWLASIFFLCTHFIFAQTTLWHQDDFSDIASGFHTSESEKIDYLYKDGKYRISCRTNNHFWVTKSIFTDVKKDFSFETEFTLKSNDNNEASYGFALTAKEKKTYFIIIKPKKGIFQISYYQTKFEYMTKEMPLATIKKNVDETNKITVSIKANKLALTINNQQAHQLENELKDLTYSYGYVVGDKLSVDMDNFKFYQDNKINVIPNAPEKLPKENLGANVNTKYAEVVPHIAPDGKTLFYSIKNNPDNIGGEKDGDDIWYSESNDNGETWQPKKNMGKPLNNHYPNSVISCTPDNNTMLLMHQYNADGSPGKGGLSMTTRTENGWGIPQNFDIEDFVSETTNEFSLSADKKVVVMSVQRPESIGKKDLFVSFSLGNNKWSKPRDMGAVVNTLQDEATPFLAADGVSMYYSTSGLPGYGSNDIFVTRRLDDTWTKWSEPQNLGKGINGKGWDAYYTIPASGKYAYMTNDNQGSLDIIRIKLPQSIQPKPVILISGTVYNSKTKATMSADITYRDLTSDKELGVAVSSPKDGAYKIVLPAGKNYAFLAEKKQFIAVSENIDLSKITEYKEIKHDLYLTPIEVGQTIRINNIFFDFSKFVLQPQSFGDLNRLVKILNDYPKMIIEVAGHTDNVGNAQNNELLSKNRAQAVSDYFTQKGIAKNRISVKGYGFAKPYANNNTEEGRKLNRRVEFKIISNE